MTDYANRKYILLKPSIGCDANWHVTDDNDLMVAHCFGFGHSVDDGKGFAHRIVECLNACKGISTEDLKNRKVKIVSNVTVRGAPLTKEKRSRRTLIKIKLQNRQRAARPFDWLVGLINLTNTQLLPTKIDWIY